MYRIGFIIEQALGHVTHGKNLQGYAAQDAQIEAHWVFPAWETRGLAAKIPLYRSNWTVRAGLRTRRALAALRRQTPLDALFFHTQVTAVFSQDWLRRIPSIISLDATPRQYDSLGVSYGHSSGPEWLENWKWRMNRDCFREARRLVTWSEWARQGLVNEYEVPAEKVTVIPPGVDTQAWRRPPGSPPLPGPVRILFVGGNLERKGGGLLLKAFRWLRQPDRVPAAGREPENPLELHLVTKDRVPAEPGVYVYDDMQPNSDRLRQLYFDSHIFCLPTDGDCLPMALSEAAAAGLPLISTRLAGIPEIVQEGRNGFLIQPGDVGALVDALQCLILDPSLRLQMGAEAAALARREFDAGRNTARLIGLIKQIAGDGTKG